MDRFEEPAVPLAGAVRRRGADGLRRRQIPNAKVDVFPEFAPPQVEIQTIALGNSSNEVEELITVPIEEQLNGLHGLDELRSKSVSQLSSIRLIFEQGTDEMRARQLVQERLAQVTPTLPTWAAPPWMMPPLSATSRIMKIGLTSDEAEPDRDVLDRLLEDPPAPAARARRGAGQHLRRAPAAAPRAGRPGQAGRERRLARRVMETTSDALDAGVLQYAGQLPAGTGGFVESDGPAAERPQRAADPEPEDLGQGPGREARQGAAAVRPGPGQGGPPADLGRRRHQRRPRPDADRPEVPRRQHDGGHRRDRGRDRRRCGPGLPGMEIDTTIFRPATFIEQSIDNLTTALLIGILLVVLIIAAFLFEWRTAFISLIAIPLSLIAAILVLDLRGATINVMVLAGLVVAIGVVVDDAIIDVENIVGACARRARGQRRVDVPDRARRLGRGAKRDHLRDGHQRRRDRAGVLPGGLSGAFFQPLVLSYGLAVLVSMLVALTVTPALCLILLSRGQLDKRESPLLRCSSAATARSSRC